MVLQWHIVSALRELQQRVLLLIFTAFPLGRVNFTLLDSCKDITFWKTSLFKKWK